MPRRAKQTKFVALNLRLPPDLHKELVKAAGSTRSLNAEILGRLKKSFELSEDEVLWNEAILNGMIERLTELLAVSKDSIEELKRRVEQIEERSRAEK